MKFNYSLNHNEVFVIAEAGSNWKVGTYDQDILRAQELIKAAVIAGADAIKFQTYNAASVYSENAGKSDYLSKQGITENVEEIFDKFSMPYDMIPKLAQMCNDQKIEFMSTPFSVEDAKQIDPFVLIHKIASFEINHIRLLEFLAKTGKPLLISTGASTMSEIEFAIDICKKNGNNKIILLQCTSKYPAPLSSMNLSVIKKLKNKFDIPVGFSDHSIEPIIAPLLSISYGASVIEKHFTLDKKFSGPDHSFALEPNEFKQMRDVVKNALSIIGTGIKDVQDDEIELRQFAKRSLQAIKDIKKGDILQEGENFDVLRPGNNSRGLDPRLLKECNGKRVKFDIKKGEGITEYE